MPSLEGVHAAVVVALLAAESNDDRHPHLPWAVLSRWAILAAATMDAAEAELALAADH